MSNHNFSRRDFLKGAAASAVGIAAMGIISGCGSTTTAESTATPTAVPEVTEVPVVSAVGDRVAGYSGPGDWLGAAPAITPDETVDCDIVIVGMGHSSVHAALTATQAGCSNVVVLEKQNADIFDWYGEDIAAYNSQISLEHGFAEYDLGQICDEYVKRAGGRCNPDIIRQFVQNSGPMMDNLMEVVAEVCADKATYAALDGIAGTVLETNVNALEEIMFTYDNTPDGQFFIQSHMDADKILAGVDPYEAENLTNYPIITGTRTWAATHCFAGLYNEEPIMGVAANSTIRYIQSAMLAKAASLGAQIKFDASAQALVQDADGKVTGVIASVGGKAVQYNTSKGVIIAGGGYAANAEMCWALLNEYMEENERLGGVKEDFFSFMGGRDGSSIKMACWAGGFLDPAPRGTMVLGGGVSSPWGSNSGLWLNAKGKRFCNEGNAQGSTRASWLQQSGIAVMLVDKNWVLSCCNSGMEHGGPDFGRPQFWTDMYETMETEPDENGQITVRTGTIMERGDATMYKADTLEELLALCGYDDATIETAIASIERYNEFCHNGSDLDYGKGTQALIPVEEAPFYATVGSLGMGGRAPGPSMVTMSGMLTDESFNVLTGTGENIPGLYACGNALGGRYGLGYQCPSAGNSIGMAVTHGYCVGKIVAGL
ncbi:MAG: FAD-binding protein [Clostridia bacterium]|nr:FAD-binding protein [Clostridia bacterium]